MGRGGGGGGGRIAERWRAVSEQLFSVPVIFTPLSRPPCRKKENEVRVGQSWAP